MKVLSNDNVLVTEPVSNDLVQYNTKFEEVKRLKGIRGDSFGKTGINRQTTRRSGTAALRATLLRATCGSGEGISSHSWIQTRTRL